MSQCHYPWHGAAHLVASAGLSVLNVGRPLAYTVKTAAAVPQPKHRSRPFGQAKQQQARHSVIGKAQGQLECFSGIGPDQTRQYNSSIIKSIKSLSATFY